VYATDSSRDIDTFIHAIDWFEANENFFPDLIIQLRPTSPVRFASDIEKCIRIMAMNTDADSLRVVTPAPITPYKMWRIEALSQPMQPLLSLEGVREPFNEPRQSLPQIYWQTGTLDIMRRVTIIEKKSMSGDIILPYIIENQFAIDIDDMSSFEKAAAIIQRFDCVKFYD
jgi:N-acylneuraminate cytidylyltransferase